MNVFTAILLNGYPRVAGAWKVTMTARETIDWLP